MGLINIGKTLTVNAISPEIGRCGFGINENNIPYLKTDDGSIILIGEGTLDQNILDALSNAETPTGQNPFVTISQLNSISGQSNLLVYGGSVQYSGTGLNFIGSASGYFIEGVFYEIQSENITLTASDLSFDRRDRFILDSSGWGFITGIPSAVPTVPQSDPITQIGRSDVLIQSNSTTPNLTNEDIYKENLEWSTGFSGVGTFNSDSTSNPFQGTKSFESTNIQQGARYIFTRSANIDLNNYSVIALEINLKSTMNNGRNLSIQFLDVSNNPISSIVNLPIVKNTTLIYQASSLDLSQFTFSDKTIVRKLQVVYVGSGGPNIYAGLFLDQIVLQGGFGGEISFEGVESVTGSAVDNTDPKNPIINLQSENSDFNPSSLPVLFDIPRKYGFTTAITGNFTVGIAGAFESSIAKVRHNDTVAPVISGPVGVEIVNDGGVYVASVDNIIYLVCHKNDAGTVTKISYTITQNQV